MKNRLLPLLLVALASLTAATALADAPPGVVVAAQAPAAGANSWWPVFAICALVLSRGFRADTRPRWLTLPARLQSYGPFLAAFFGALFTGIDDFAHGATPQIATMHAIVILFGVPALAFTSPAGAPSVPPVA